MSTKGNIRSFRFSDEVMAILLGFGPEGASLNSKFESLVLWCNLELPALNQKIKSREEALKKLEDEYRELMKRTYDQRAIGRELDGVMTECRRMKMKLLEVNQKIDETVTQILPDTAGS